MKYGLLKILCMIACAFLPCGIKAQSCYPGLFEQKMSVDAAVSPAAKSFPLNRVRLLPSRFKDNMERDSAWMVSIDINSLVHSFRNSSGVYSSREGGYKTIKKYGGWESLDCDLRGHTTGHLMSAYALMYASTGSGIFKAKGDSIVAALAEVQNAYGNGYLSAFPEELINRNIEGQSVWAPWYTLHKILAGLIDQYLYASNDTALDIAKKMGDWAFNKLSNLDDSTRRLMIRNEFGGVNEAFYNLYAVTGDDKYRFLAEFFYHNDVIDPLKEGSHEYGTKHANTFIPKIIAEMRRYELIGDTDSKGLSENFWNDMVSRHVYAAGCLSEKEHFFDPEAMHSKLTGYTGESCCTYNMLKLSKHIFSFNPIARV
ncbi:MAG: glycoside hydrolase family 127 protein, partial [Bacteroidaceae bacterium]|nr:glycoside hydrolase family 127 protein [Bacteroidaceae bacterium]